MFANRVSPPCPTTPLRRKLRWLGFALALVTGLIFQNRAFASLKVEQTRWGFDGKCVQERFNLLSVRIVNPGTESFDGELVLRKHRGGGGRLDAVDAPVIEPLYLAPGAGRWVQFYAYVDRPTFEIWSLSWGKGAKNEAQLPQQSTTGENAAVVLDDSGALGALRVGARIFPEEIFPARVTACDALKSVVLDHEPRWNDVQQQTFLDWVRLGGEAHIFQDATRKFPKFTGPLDILNDDAPRRRFGAGLIFHHDLTVNTLDEKTFRRVVLRTSPLDDDEAGALDGAQAIPEMPQANARFFNDTEIEGDSSLLRQLKGLTRAEHNWVLIHLLSLVYLLLVFPGCWKLGQERVGDYRLVFGSLLGTVGLFSLAFLYIGSRGAGEATAIDTLVVARPIDDKRFDVTGWSNGFVVAGGDYLFTHEGLGRIYSTGQTEEDVRGVIRNGADAGLTTDMPPFSARTLLHRAVVAAPPIQLKVAGIGRGVESRNVDYIKGKVLATKTESVEVLQSLRITATGAGLPKRIHRTAAVYGRYFYPLVVKSGANADEIVLEMPAPGGQSIAALMHVDQGTFAMQPWGYEQPRDRKSMFDSMFERGTQRSLGLLMASDAVRFELPTDRVRVLIYCDLPKEFQLKSDQFGSQYGRCMYSLDLLLGDAK